MKEPVTAETAVLVKVAEDLKTATGKIHRQAQLAEQELAFREGDQLATVVVQLADATDDLADLVMRLSLRLELVESQQIGRALARGAARDPDHHD
jgi:hypothetical protein